MNPSWSRVAAAAALLAALTACGASEQSPDAPQLGATSEQITAGGVAALVDEHLGTDQVRQYGTYGHEAGSVDVMVQLRGADRRNLFVVSVPSPEGADQEYGGAADASCDQLRRQGTRRGGRTWCEELADGGVASVQLINYGFSDDNAHGRVLMGLAAEPEGRLATAMYESYTPAVAVVPEDLLALMADERLTWMTDPALNDAGRDINVRPLRGG